MADSRIAVERECLYGDERPCDCAFREEGWRLDRRTFRNIQEHDAKFPATPWTAKGFDHFSWVDAAGNPGIERKISVQRWYVHDSDVMMLMRIYSPCRMEVNSDGDADFLLVLGSGAEDPQGEIRTLMPSRAVDFEPTASAVPPPGASREDTR